MVSSNQIKQFSASWGYSIDGTTEQLYQQMALQGHRVTPPLCKYHGRVPAYSPPVNPSSSACS